MFLFFRYFFSFHQYYPQIGRDASRLCVLLCCVHNGKGCTRLRRSANNAHFITIYFAGAAVAVTRNYFFYFSNLPQGVSKFQEETPWLL